MKRMLRLSILALLWGLCVISVQGIPTHAAEHELNTPETVPQWWKGNLHTHSFWSDGDDFPEMIVDWYKQNGYHFLALSDHNTLSQGTRWMRVTENSNRMTAYTKYVDRFGPGWVEQRNQDGILSVRLKPLSEFRPLFDEPGRFLLIQGEEISDAFGSRPVHLNASNLVHLIPPQGGTSVLNVMQNNVDAVIAQREELGQAMMVHLNHPNFGWAVTAEEIAALKGERFFEVYNGHPSVRNYGDENHASMERMWDIILTLRLGEPEGEIIYGIAVDDSHNYHEQGSNKSNAGRGWVMVQSAHLTPESIISAMDRGDFYASTGVVIRRISCDAEHIAVEIVSEPGVSYTTQFIGTRHGYDPTTEDVSIMENGMPHPLTRRYSADVGALLAEVHGTTPTYRLAGDEIYVRAKIISSKAKANPYAEGEVEVAWTQPFIVGKGDQPAAQKP